MVCRELLSTWALVLATMAACKGGSEPEPAAALPPSATAEPATPVAAEPEPAVAVAVAAEVVPEPAAAEVEPEVLRVLELLGDEGAAVVVVRPQHWAALHGVLAPWLATVSAEASALANTVREPAALPGLLARWLGSAGDSTVDSVGLGGWDPTRSVVVSLGEVPYGGPPGAVTPSLSTRPIRISPVRHQVWLPATDPAALVASLDALLGGLGTPFPTLVKGRAGARAVHGDDVAIAMLPVPDAVRVVVFESGFGGDDATRLEHMRGRLDAEARASASTPALGLLARPDAVLSGLMRPWRMRPLAVWSGSLEIMNAIATAPPHMLTFAMGRGLQIVLDAELLMTDEGAELDDTAQSLVIDDGVLRLRSVMSLTPEGEAIMAAATKGAGRALATKADDAWVDVTVQADMRAMLEATEPPPAFARAEAAGDLARAIQEGGYFATAYMGLRHPFGVLRVADRLAQTERLPMPIDVLPNAARVVWRGTGDEGPRVVMALHWPEDYVDRPLAGMVPMLKAQPGFESLRMDAVRRDGRPVTVFGLGGESVTGLDSGEGSSVPGLLRARVSLARIGADLATRDPERGAWLAGAGELRLTFEHRDRALMGELAWAPGKDAVRAEPVPRLMHQSGEAGWTSPVGTPTSKGATCLAQAGRTVAQGLGAMVSTAPEHHAKVLSSTRLEAEEPLRCAAADEATAEAAAALRRMIAAGAAVNTEAKP